MKDKLVSMYKEEEFMIRQKNSVPLSISRYDHESATEENFD